jgi:hypothetical protein
MLNFAYFCYDDDDDDDDDDNNNNNNNNNIATRLRAERYGLKSQ